MSGVKLERSLAVRLSQMARNPTLVGARGIRTTPRRSVDVAAPGVRWFKVVGSTLIGDNRWSYSLQDIDDSDVIVSALNKMEDANTADEAGPSYDIAGLPTGLVLLPIGKDRNGIDIECVVDAWLGDDDDGNEVWWFSKTNVVDGECATGSGGGDALVADGLDQFAPTTSAELASIISDPTGTGELVFASSPTLVTPTLGVAAATSLNKVAVTAPATGATLTIADGKTLTASDNATVSGTNTGDQVVTGRLLGIYVHTSGTTHTTAAGCNTIRVRMVGGGGGSGGMANTASRSGASGGGGAGGYAEKVFAVTPSTGYTYAVGGAGSAGTSGANNGGDGGDSTFTVGGTTVTAKGGLGGKGGTAASGVLCPGGGPSPISTNGDINGAGAPGGMGVNGGSTTYAIGGHGGSGPFGGGGLGASAQGAGAVGVGYGVGGGGSSSINGGGSVAGALGLAGVVIVEEYS